MKDVIMLTPLNNHNNGSFMTTDFNTIRKYTQARELLLQGITIKNTLKEMEHVWYSLYTPEQECVIVNQEASKIKHQAVNIYAVKLINYVKSIFGMDLLPLAQQDFNSDHWKIDIIVLNVAGNKIKDHKDLFVKLMVNIFGVSETLIELGFNPNWELLKTYFFDNYGTKIDIYREDMPELSLEYIEKAFEDYLSNKEIGFKL